MSSRRGSAAKEISAREALTDQARRIDEVNPAINAVVTRGDDRAMAEAAAADEALATGEEVGVLHGGADDP